MVRDLYFSRKPKLTTKALKLQTMIFTQSMTYGSCQFRARLKYSFKESRKQTYNKCDQRLITNAGTTEKKLSH